MEKIKKMVEVEKEVPVTEKIKEQVEVDAVQITLDEFVVIAADECTKLFFELVSEGEPNAVDIVIPIACSKFASQLADRIFGDNDDKKEESEEN